MKVLFIVTSSDKGTWLSEVTHPYWHLLYKSAGNASSSKHETGSEDPLRRLFFDSLRNAADVRILEEKPGRYLLVEFDDPKAR